MFVIPVHKDPSLLDECCNLINIEWPRSKTARMRTLQMSCDTLPTCLALVAEDKVMGHSKLSAIGCIPGACFVESVVIHPDHRGKGLGRLIMCETEKYALSQGMDTIFLSTIDQQDFYKKIGYTECAPVSIYGCSIGDYSKIAETTTGKEDWKRELSYNNILKSPPTTAVSPPPPPPFPPPFKTPVNSSKSGFSVPHKNQILIRKTFFKKKIS